MKQCTPYYLATGTPAHRQRLAPAALGFITVFFGLGQAISPGIAGAMADAAGSFSSAFLLAAIVATLGAIGALSLPDDRSRSEAVADSG